MSTEFYTGYIFGNPDRFAWSKKPEPEYAVRHVDVDGWPLIRIHESRAEAEKDFATCGLNCTIVRMTGADTWERVDD